jgi:hypothetical protein
MIMNAIHIRRGFFSNGSEFNDVTLPLNEAPVLNNPSITGVKGFPYTALVSTVHSHLPRKRTNARVYFESEADYTLTAADTVRSSEAAASVDERTDAEVAADIADRFECLTLLSEASADRAVRALLVSGTAGTGKTYEVETAMRRKRTADPRFFYQHVKGSISPIRLYIELFHARDGVLILDDSDNAFNEPEAMQILKAATESSKRRLVSWMKMSRALEEFGIPNEFEFNGCVVILTNTDLEEGSSKRAPHYEALVSRAHYINTVLRTDREKVIRIKQVIENSRLLHSFVDESHHSDIIHILETEAEKFRELSIRTVVKMAELTSKFPSSWKKMVRVTLMKN